MGRCALARQAVQAGVALSSLYRTIYVALHTPKPVRYTGVFTNGGTDNALQQFNADNLCAPISFQVSVQRDNSLHTAKVTHTG